MALKELTWDNHQKAESTKFMKAVFKKKMPMSIWADYTYNKMLWYNAIEIKARAMGISDDLPDLDRTFKLYQDAKELTGGNFPTYRQEAIDYHRYILDLETPEQVLAHLYTWHMGDLYGGQMIKKIVAGPHRNLEFKDQEGLRNAIRTKLDDSMGPEANRAFEWAIKIMDSYANELDLEESQ